MSESSPAPHQGMRTIDPTTERHFYDQLDEFASSIVPVVGAGLAIAAGAPSTNDLIAGLLQATGASWRAQYADGSALGLYDLADRLADDFSEGWVQDEIARIVGERELVATPVLQAVAKAGTGLIVTTNYDLAVEVSAAAAGIETRTFTANEIDLALAQPVGLRVVHLHGVWDRPETIVLTARSYAAIARDELAQHLVRDLSLRHRLLFLGHRLGDREAHMRRDILWASQVAVHAAQPGRHLLITSQQSLTDPSLAEWADGVFQASGVQVIAFEDPQHEHLATARAAHVIAGPSSLAGEDVAPAVARNSLDPHYVPLPVTDANEVEDPSSTGAHLFRTWRDGEITARELDRKESRLLLVAGGGHGKSEELRQIGWRSRRPALLQTLTGLQPGDSWTDPGITFVRCMSNSSGATPEQVGRLTLERLRRESYLFLLDGLDEVPTVRRERVTQLISEVARAYPQHRYVVASRQVPGLGSLEGFALWTPVPDGAWLRRYTEARSVPVGDLDAVLDNASGLADLVRIPIFAASVLDHIERGDPLPTTAIELVWRLGDDRTNRDPRIGADPSDVRVWLDRLALLLEVAGTTEISAEQLLDTTLHEDLSTLAPSQELLGELAVRSLLVDLAGTVRFPANIMQEARAARALLLADEAGLEMFQQKVLVELPVLDQRAQPVRAVHPSWVNTVELALAKAPPTWWDLVRGFDPMLAARATATSQLAEAEVHAAAWTIWRTYLSRRVWMDRAQSTLERDDAGALARLVARSEPPGFSDELLQRVTDPEPTIRANALQGLLGLLNRSALLPLVEAAVQDPHPVVRRQAAWVALELQATELAGALASSAHRGGDEMATQTLTDFAVELAGDDTTAIEIAARAPATAADGAARALARRLPRATAIQLVRSSSPVNMRLLDGVLAGATRSIVRDEWSDADVAALMHFVAEHPEETLGINELDSVLAVHPLAAFAARLTHSPGEWLHYDLGRIFGHADDALLSAAIDAARRRDHPVFATAEVSPDSLKLATVEASLDYLESIARARTHPSPLRSTVPAARRNRRGLAAALADGDWAEALRSSPESEDSASMPTGLREEVHRRWRAVSELGTLHRVNVEWTGSVDAHLLRTIEWAARLPIAPEERDWTDLAVFALRWRDSHISRWVKNCWQLEFWPAFRERLELLNAEELSRAGDLVAPPWPDGLARKVLDGAAAASVTDGDKRQAAQSVVDANEEQALREWLGSQAPRWLLPLLVQIGDCAAEQRLIEDLIENPDALQSWPLRHQQEWLRHVQCSESTERLVAVLTKALTAGRAAIDVDECHRALRRCAGYGVLRIYEDMIEDSRIPGATFLYYQRQEALNALVVSHAGPRSVEDRALQSVISTSVRHG